MQNDLNKPLCDHCGHTLENFLSQMEEHNLEVVCPSCGKAQSGAKHVHEVGDNGNAFDSPRPIQSMSQKDVRPDLQSGSPKKH